MARFFDPSMLARTYRDPVAWGSLIVDLIPVFAVVFLGWGAVALVFLYWLENLVIGAVAALRILTASTKDGVFGVIGACFIVAFLTLHFGAFCFIHGQFLAAFAQLLPNASGEFLSPFQLVQAALDSGAGMLAFISIIAAWMLGLYAYDFVWRGEYRRAHIPDEMVSPYLRIVVLHVAIIVGGYALFAIGEPMLGVLGLILLRAFWGMLLSVGRRRRLDARKT